MTGDLVKRKRAAPIKSAKAPIFLLTVSSKKDKNFLALSVLHKSK